MFLYTKELAKELQKVIEAVEFQKAVKEIEDDENYVIRIKITNESEDRDGEIIKAD